MQRRFINSCWLLVLAAEAFADPGVRPTCGSLETWAPVYVGRVGGLSAQVPKHLPVPPVIPNEASRVLTPAEMNLLIDFGAAPDVIRSAVEKPELLAKLIVFSEAAGAVSSWPEEVIKTIRYWYPQPIYSGDVFVHAASDPDIPGEVIQENYLGTNTVLMAIPFAQARRLLLSDSLAQNKLTLSAAAVDLLAKHLEDPVLYPVLEGLKPLSKAVREERISARLEAFLVNMRSRPKAKFDRVKEQVVEFFAARRPTKDAKDKAELRKWQIAYGAIAAGTTSEARHALANVSDANVRLFLFHLLNKFYSDHEGFFTADPRPEFIESYVSRHSRPFLRKMLISPDCYEQLAYFLSLVFGNGLILEEFEQAPLRQGFAKYLAVYLKELLRETRHEVHGQSPGGNGGGGGRVIHIDSPSSGQNHNHSNPGFSRRRQKALAAAAATEKAVDDQQEKAPEEAVTAPAEISLEDMLRDLEPLSLSPGHFKRMRAELTSLYSLKPLMFQRIARPFYQLLHAPNRRFDQSSHTWTHVEGKLWEIWGTDGLRLYFTPYDSRVYFVAVNNKTSNHDPKVESDYAPAAAAFHSKMNAQRQLEKKKNP